jgi:hypothetical protein
MANRPAFLSADDGKSKLPKFNPLEFNNWKEDMENFLRGKCVFGAIDHAADGWGALNAMFRGQMCGKAWSYLHEALVPDYRYAMAGIVPKDPLVLWASLLQHYDVQDARRIAELTRRINSFKWESNDSVEKFMGRMSTIRSDHVLAQLPLPEIVAIEHVRLKLPSVYKTIKSTIHANPNITWEQVHRMLIEMEKILNEESSETVDAQAFFAAKDRARKSNELRKKIKD